MHPYKRSDRLNILLREEIADIIMKRVKDPRFGFVTVTEVSLSDDLKIAKVYISVFNRDEQNLAIEILDSVKGVMRNEIAKRVRMKRVPQLEFRIDESIDRGLIIDKLLRDIHSKRSSEEADE